MEVAVTARDAPRRRALESPHGRRSFDELNARINRIARLLRARGLGPGDGVALLCANRPEFVEVSYACFRTGLRLTPVNWHLTADESAYIVDDCEARAFVADARFADAAGEAARRAPKASLRIAVGGAIPGFERLDELLEEQPEHDLEDPALGGLMFYTSGTTGRPKGVYRRERTVSSLVAPLSRTAAFRPDDDVALCTGPLYHAAPMVLNLQFPLSQGIPVVLMDRWDAEDTLRLVEEHRVTHTHMVPTMFHRLLQLADEVRGRYDTATLRWVVHGAAPCPVHVKRSLIEWLGPVVYEYYAATEGGGTFIEPEEWLAKPGSVGRVIEGQRIEVHDEEGRSADPGAVGTVYIDAPDRGRFEYFKDPSKTASAYRGDRFTLGDMGYFDEDGYLFLTGRSAELIISGGVNIYPAEVDEVLLMHPAVLDAATVGVPNAEWGEEVKAVVQLAPGCEPSDALATELIEHCRARLAAFKCPRSVDWTDDLPRLPSGKIVRRRVRARYWPDGG